MATDLEGALEQKLLECYETAKQQLGYNATRFLQKLRRDGGVAAARTLLRRRGSRDKPPAGFIKMVDFNRLGISVEALVLRQPWRSLFTDEELQVAHDRLARYGYFERSTRSRSKATSPDEVPNESKYPEGAKLQVTVNSYERNPKAREACIAHYGRACYVCDMSFADVYGEEAENIIHVHHLCSLSAIGAQYQVDPIADLRPVCPNCHAVIHLTTPPQSIEEVREMLRKRGPNPRAQQTRAQRTTRH